MTAFLDSETKRLTRAARLMTLAFVAAGLTFICQPAFAAGPDLAVWIGGPGKARAGSDIGGSIAIMALNLGRNGALGTQIAGKKGYVIDVFLTRGAIPSGLATYSANYADGVLLKGGRVSNTSTLKPGQMRAYRAGGGIPADTPSGEYWLCAQIDPARVMPETSEINNVSCTPLIVNR